MPAARVRRINRFTVMAILQAARAQRLGMPEASAYSWGLNRAIFYAAAKRGFRGPAGTPSETPKEGVPAPAARAPTGETYYLGDDMAYRVPFVPELVFTIGNEVQTPQDFDRQIVGRFGTPANFRAAWDEAARVVGAFDPPVLLSGHRFYAEVYQPRRDALAEAWAARFGAEGPASATTPRAGARAPRRRRVP